MTTRPDIVALLLDMDLHRDRVARLRTGAMTIPRPDYRPSGRGNLVPPAYRRLPVPQAPVSASGPNWPEGNEPSVGLQHSMCEIMATVTIGNRPLPSRDDLITLIQASLRNAGDLLDDARLLLDAGRPPRAHALATLALEETGKAFVCVMAVIPGGAATFFGPKAKDNFWAAWREHSDKLTWALGFLELVVREPADPATKAAERQMRAAKDGHLRKLRGLYVDYDDAVLLPADVAVAEARELIADAQALLDVAAETWLADGLPERVRDLDNHREALANMLELAQQAIQADTDQTVTSVRQFFHDQRTPDAATTQDSGHPDR